MLAGLKAQPLKQDEPKRGPQRRYTVIEMVAQDGGMPGHVLIPSYKISKSQLITEQH